MSLAAEARRYFQKVLGSEEGSPWLRRIMFPNSCEIWQKCPPCSSNEWVTGRPRNARLAAADSFCRTPDDHFQP
jgi:hypothetical protein